MTTPDLTRARWRKSSRSNANGACVEAAYVPGMAAVRDSKNPAGDILVFEPCEWDSFRHAVKAGKFDLA